MTRDERMALLLEQKAQLVAYLLSKAKAEDWHACADAAMDIREIEAARAALRAVHDDESEIADDAMDWTTPYDLRAGETVQIRIPRRFKVE